MAPICILNIGMAGSGKSALMQRLQSECNRRGDTSYVINLDPAVHRVPFDPQVDIRDTIDYRRVMEEFHLGPNGAIMTCLNLFTTKFGQVLELLEKRAPSILNDADENATGKATGNAEEDHEDALVPLDYILVDTPGQIEVFTWSASGSIITTSLASTYPTILLYIIDTSKCTSPVTFMSNMLYACSIMYRTRLPLVIALNKCDVQSGEFAVEWMKDFEAFQQAMEGNEEQMGYMGSLVMSMGLVLEEFYEQLSVVCCSAVTGQGMEELFDAFQDAADEYYSEYLPDLKKAHMKQTFEEKARQKESMERLMQDLSVKDQEQ